MLAILSRIAVCLVHKKSIERSIISIELLVNNCIYIPQFTKKLKSLYSFNIILLLQLFRNNCFNHCINFVSNVHSNITFITLMHLF